MYIPRKDVFSETPKHFQGLIFQQRRVSRSARSRVHQHHYPQSFWVGLKIVYSGTVRYCKNRLNIFQPTLGFLSAIGGKYGNYEQGYPQVLKAGEFFFGVRYGEGFANSYFPTSNDVKLVQNGDLLLRAAVGAIGGRYQWFQPIGFLEFFICT